jgi:hypothetical protein
MAVTEPEFNYFSVLWFVWLKAYTLILGEH